MLWPQFRRSPSAVPLACASLLALLCAVSGAQAEAALEPCAGGADLQRAVERLNEVRLSGDAPCAAATRSIEPLVWEPRLAGSALTQARDNAERDLLSHQDAQQRGLGARLRSAGYAAAAAGENLAAGQTDFDDTLQAWLASPSHCANLMQPQFSDVGLACVQRPGSRYERFWVAHLGTPVRPAARLAAAVSPVAVALR